MYEKIQKFQMKKARQTMNSVRNLVDYTYTEDINSEK